MKPLPASLVLLLILASPLAAQGPTPEAGVVSADGSVTLERPPQVMRLRVDLISKAGTLKEALEGLKQRTASARTQLADFGADAESINVESPRVSVQMSDTQRQIMQYMQQRLQRGGRAAAKPKTAMPVMVSATLTAEWKLEGENAEELLLTVQPLQDRIREADLAGATDAQQLTPEQQELVEEMQGEMGVYSSGESSPGEPVFVFATPVSDVEHEQALAHAFAKARAHAIRLAKAAGAELGPLKSLSSHTATGGMDENYGAFGFDSYAYRGLQMASPPQQDSLEATSAGADLTKITFTVSASFQLKP